MTTEAPVPGLRRCVECKELVRLDDAQFTWDELRCLCGDCYLQWQIRGGEHIEKVEAGARIEL